MQHIEHIGALEKRTDELVLEATSLTTQMKADDLLATDLEEEAGKASGNVLALMCGYNVGELLPQTAVTLHGELAAQAKKARRICQASAKKTVEAWEHVLEIKRLTFVEMRLVELEERVNALESPRHSSHPGGVYKRRKCA